MRRAVDTRETNEVGEKGDDLVLPPVDLGVNRGVDGIGHRFALSITLRDSVHL